MTDVTMPVTTMSMINHSLLGNYTVYSDVFHAHAHLIVMEHVFSVYYGMIRKLFGSNNSSA